MKKVIRFFVLFVLVLELALGSLPPTSAQSNQPLEGDNPQTAPVNDEGGMPGWPVPDKPIPQHEPGAPSRAAGYSTQLTRLNAEGAEEVVNLTGLEAMLADGVIKDPLAGSYRLVGKEDIALGVYDIGDYSIDLKTYQDNTIDPVTGSATQLAPADGSKHQSLDLAAGDLNGDGVDEQIAAWVDVDTRHIMLAIGEMPGTNGRSSSEPAAAASGDQVDLLVRGYDQALWQSHFDGAAWGDWNNDGGGLLLSGPAVASRGGAAFEVFAVGTDNQVLQRSWDGAGWGGAWVSLPADAVFTTVPTWVGSPPELEAPAVVARGTDAFDVFRIAPDRTLRWSRFYESSWSSWSSLGGMFAYGPGAVLLDDGSIQVFAIGVDQSLWYLHSMGDDWEKDGPAYHWKRVELEGMDPGVRPVSAPSIVQLPGGQVQVFVRASDDALWQITYDDGSWGAWSKGGAGLASRPTTAVRSSGLILFGLTPLGSLQQSIDGTTWEDLAQPWLPACCLGTPIDTEIYAYATDSTNPVDQLNLLDIETGHFLGDGRQQIALAYTWADPSDATKTGIGLRLFDINDGFRTLKLLGQIDDTTHEEDYYPKLAVGEFDGGEAPQEIALAYATRRGGVRVYTGDFEGTEIAWLKPRAPDLGMGDMGAWYNLYEEQSDFPWYGEDMNNEISSIKIEPGWIVCVKDKWDYGQQCWGYTEENQGRIDLDSDWNDKISYVYVGITIPGSGNNFVDVTDGIYDQRNAYIALEIFAVDPQEPKPVSLAVDYYEMWFTDTDEYPAPERTLGIVAGDFDGTLNPQGRLDDEIALIWDKMCWEWYFATPLLINYYCKNYRSYFHILDVEMKDGSMSISDDRAIEIQKFSLNNNIGYSNSAEINLTEGDFDGDGRDEIARTWPENFQGDSWPNLDRNLQVLDWDTEDVTYTLKSAPPLESSTHTYEDALAAVDLNFDLNDEIVYNEAHTNKVYVYTFTPDGGPNMEKNQDFPNPDDNVFVLATGDFSGESLRVGPPSYRVQERVDSYLARLNMPPKHWDMIKQADGSYRTIQILTEECWTSPKDPKCTHTLHGTVEGESSSTSIETKADWATATGSEWKFSNTFLIEGSMEKTYGKNFSNFDLTSATTTFSEDTTAGYDDALIFYKNSYHIWEYPIYIDNTLEPARYITVMFPEFSQVNKSDTGAGAICEEGWYNPGHQPYNIWSYDPIGSIYFPDYDPDNKIVETTITGAESEFKVDYSEFEVNKTESSQWHEINSDHGVGFEVSGSVGINLEIFSAQRNFENRFKAYTKSDYKWEEHITEETQTSNETFFSAYFASVQSPDIFTTRAVAYWSTVGPLVIDFQTNPGPAGSEATWQLYNKPDPAFILPWYGYPDPDNLPYPDVNNQGAPPCGVDKQYFSRDILIDPPLTSVGETVVISATVRNFSNVNIPKPVTVRFYQGLPGSNNDLGECTIPAFNRDAGPQTCAISWNVIGEGEQKIYAVIDPDHQIDEMHDQDHIINNNMGYGLLQVGAASYVDMGAGEPYELIRYNQSDTLSVALYVPSANLNATTRFDIFDVPENNAVSIGNPFGVVATQGTTNRRWGEPIEDFPLSLMGDPPAVIAVAYGDADLSGFDEIKLRLYRLDDSGWVEATCPGYELYRFVNDNTIVVPICQTGTFVLSDQQPSTEINIYLPIISN